VVAVSDADLGLAKEVAARLPSATFHATGEQLIAANEVDAVIVTSWGDTHAAYVIAAIKAGKPVFCEKPMATTEVDCSAILDAEAVFGKRLVQIGFMRRFDAQYRAMKETVQTGAIGFPLMFHSVHRNASSPGHFKAMMAITDTAVHDIDIARFVLDDEPVAIAVKAPRGNSRAGGVADPLFTLMDMRSGALVTIETSVHIAYGYDIRGEVIGETGTVSLAEQSDVVIKTNGAFSGRVFGDWPERFGPAFDAEFRAWIAAAAKG
jgi:myo-inositol 2-dehydrogenase / D-chiro-inositol 1-dehydrogenase